MTVHNTVSSLLCFALFRYFCVQIHMRKQVRGVLIRTIYLCYALVLSYSRILIFKFVHRHQHILILYFHPDEGSLTCSDVYEWLLRWPQLGLQYASKVRGVRGWE
jgi:hypothetical protein